METCALVCFIVLTGVIDFLGILLIDTSYRIKYSGGNRFASVLLLVIGIVIIAANQHTFLH